MKNYIVVGFEIDIDNIGRYDNLTDHEKHELALSNEDAVIYDNTKTFFQELNDGFVDTENKKWYLIKI
jgi:hypothetical protein